MSQLLWETVMLYFGKQVLFLETVLGCSRCGSQYSWHLGYCNPSNSSAQGQTSFGFYRQGSESLSNLIFLKALVRLMPDFWSNNW